MQTFRKKRYESNNPFLALYYEILSRHHVDNFNKAIDEMAEPLKSIIIDCHKVLRSEGYKYALCYYHCAVCDSHELRAKEMPNPFTRLYYEIRKWFLLGTDVLMDIILAKCLRLIEDEDETKTQYYCLSCGGNEFWLTVTDEP